MRLRWFHVERRRPLQKLSFSLVRSDAFAYETLPRELAGWRLIFFIVWISLAGAVVSLLPDAWVGEQYGWRFWAWMAAFGLVQYGLAVVAMTFLAHRRAALRLPRPVAVVAIDHVDHIEWREDGVTVFIAVETMGVIITAAQHIFVHAADRVLILPARAFLNRHEMTTFAWALDQRVEASET